MDKREKLGKRGSESGGNERRDGISRDGTGLAGAKCRDGAELAGAECRDGVDRDGMEHHYKKPGNTENHRIAHI